MRRAEVNGKPASFVRVSDAARASAAGSAGQSYGRVVVARSVSEILSAEEPKREPNQRFRRIPSA